MKSYELRYSYKFPGSLPIWLECLVEGERNDPFPQSFSILFLSLGARPRRSDYSKATQTEEKVVQGLSAEETQDNIQCKTQADSQYQQTEPTVVETEAFFFFLLIFSSFCETGSHSVPQPRLEFPPYIAQAELFSYLQVSSYQIARLASNSWNEPMQMLWKEFAVYGPIEKKTMIVLGVYGRGYPLPVRRTGSIERDGFNLAGFLLCLPAISSWSSTCLDGAPHIPGNSSPIVNPLWKHSYIPHQSSMHSST